MGLSSPCLISSWSAFASLGLAGMTTSIIDQESVSGLLFFVCDGDLHFYTDSSNKQVFWVEWDIYDFSRMMQCREMQAWYDSRGEKEVQDAVGRGEKHGI